MKISVLGLRRHSYAKREKSNVGMSITMWIRPDIPSERQVCSDHGGVFTKNEKKGISECYAALRKMATIYG